MGSFSWYKADKKDNIVYGDTVKMLIPKEFGGGYILGTYEDYGDINENGIIHDIYELVALWNNKKLYNTVKKMGYSNPARKPSDNDINSKKNVTHSVRKYGIAIACYDEDNAKCKYPIKIVSEKYNLTYEECENISLSDETQGFRRHSWKDKLTYKEYTEKMKNKKKQIPQKEVKQRLTKIFEELENLNRKIF